MIRSWIDSQSNTIMSCIVSEAARFVALPMRGKSMIPMAYRGAGLTT